MEHIDNKTKIVISYDNKLNGNHLRRFRLYFDWEEFHLILRLYQDLTSV
jgi:hypothetical protein